MSKTMGALRLRVSELAADLHEAKSDAKLLARLQSAEARAKALGAEYSEAMSALRKAEIAAEKDEREGRYRGLSDLEIVEVPDQDGGGILRSTWRISYTASAFDGYSSKPAKVTKNGFEELEPNVMAFLIEHHPERIPANIMALAPDDPRAAFSRYFVAKRRGYLIGNAA